MLDVGMFRSRGDDTRLIAEIFYETTDVDDNGGGNDMDAIEIDGECYYDTVVVDEAEWSTNTASSAIDDKWNDDDGELLAEICVEPTSVVEWQHSSGRRNYEADLMAKEQEEQEEDDCTNLSWLMNFRVDEIINGRVAKRGKEPRSREPIVNNDERASAAGRSECKPPYTYTKLIELALKEKGQLTVSGIYKWISDRYPFFKPNDERWKNSVRHNLSINPHFRKGAKAARGSGHLWGVATHSAAFDSVIDSHKKIKVQPTLEQEVAAAAASILQQHPTEFLNPVSVEQVAAECGLLDGPLSFSY